TRRRRRLRNSSADRVGRKLRDARPAAKSEAIRLSLGRGRRAFVTSRALIRRAAEPAQIAGAVDQRQMREGLRKIANHPARLRIVLFAPEAQIVAQTPPP